jgi:hypothetical protein
VYLVLSGLVLMPASSLLSALWATGHKGLTGCTRFGKFLGMGYSLVNGPAGTVKQDALTASKEEDAATLATSVGTARVPHTADGWKDVGALFDNRTFFDLALSLMVGVLLDPRAKLMKRRRTACTSSRRSCSWNRGTCSHLSSNTSSCSLPTSIS